MHNLANSRRSRSFCPVSCWNSGCRMISLHIDSMRAIKVKDAWCLAAGRASYTLSIHWLRVTTLTKFTEVSWCLKISSKKASLCTSLSYHRHFFLWFVVLLNFDEPVIQLYKISFNNNNTFLDPLKTTKAQQGQWQPLERIWSACRRFAQAKLQYFLSVAHTHTCSLVRSPGHDRMRTCPQDPLEDSGWVHNIGITWVLWVLFLLSWLKCKTVLTERHQDRRC